VKSFLNFLKENSRDIQEKWVEYDFNYGEDKKEGMKIKRKYRKKFELPSTLPGEIDASQTKDK
jgi:hypothetical protein